ncbi:MAG: hypothetical protein ABIH67_00985 [Candidatus Uhrbacteria bacterium]
MKKIILAIFLLLVTLGVAWFVYNRFFDVDYQIRSMVKAMQEVESVQVDISGTIQEESVQAGLRMIDGQTYVSFPGMEQLGLAEQWVKLEDLQSEEIGFFDELADFAELIIASKRDISEITNGQATKVYDIVPNLEIINQDYANLTGVLWINPRSHLLSQAKINGTIIYPEVGETTYDLVLVFSKYNQADQIETPEVGVLDLPQGSAEREQIFTDPESNGKETNGNTSAGARDTDGDGLPDADEGFWGTNMYDPDSDDDGVSDGEEVKNGQDPTGSGSLFNFGLPE